MMGSLATTDLSDDHGDKVHYCTPVFRDFGGRLAFHGPVTTLKTFEDNTKVRTAVEEPGESRVLVVDGGGSLNCALFGGNLAALAAQNGWSGVVINGCVRDCDELKVAAVGIKALAPHPRKSNKSDAGEHDIPVTFAGVTFTPGDWLYADADGIIVAAQELA
ncbi:MAG: ribonuclease E activity regulator RraA [Parvularculales bacterium]